MRCSRSHICLFPAARALLTLIVIGAVLWTIVPATTFSAGRLCAMACCAGKAPHEAGSCHHGSCHARLAIRPGGRSKSIKICGLSTGAPRLLDAVVRLVIMAPVKDAIRGQIDKTGLDGNSHSNHTNSSGPQAAARVFTRPCTNGCGAGSSASSNLGRSRNPAAPGHPIEPTQPALTKIAQSNHSTSQTIATLSCQGGPRAPPASLS